METRLTVAWISDFPIEWLSGLPETLRSLPRQHPATWQLVLLDEFEKNSNLKLHVIALRKHIPTSVKFERNGVHFHVLKVTAGLRAPSLFWLDSVLIRRVLREIEPDMIHAWGTERGSALIATRLGLPFVVTIQGLLTWYCNVTKVHLYDRFAARLEDYSLRRTRVATTESKFAVGYLQQRYPQLKVYQAEHAPNWLFHRVARHPQTNPLRLLAVGTLGHRKGSDLLLHALNKLTPELDFELVVVGSTNNPWAQKLRCDLSPAFWNRIQFKHGLQPSEVGAELSKAAFTILPTRADTSPNAVKESVVAAVPVVASRVGGIPDYVFHGQNGLLFEAGSLQQLTDSIRVAAGHPLFSRGEVERASLTRNRNYLSPSQMAEDFLHVYELALGHAPTETQANR